MEQCFADGWANPSSSHSLGLKARKAIDVARDQVAAFVNAHSSQVIFTCSATEANNTVLRSGASAHGKEIITTAAEHSSILGCCNALKRDGAKIEIVPVLASGAIELSSIASVLSTKTSIVSVIWANNETGVLNPIRDVARLCRQKGVQFHCDAVQAAGKVLIDFQEIGAHYLTISSHKIFGPKGAGALIIDSDVSLKPLLVGGNQEDGRRGGTENVPAIIGFGKACQLAYEQLDKRCRFVGQLRDKLENGILSEIPGTYLNGTGVARIQNTSNIGFSGYDSDTLVELLDQLGICVSSGSACLAESNTPSHVILAMTGSYRKASEAIRFSLSHLNTWEDIDRTIDCLKDVTKRVAKSRKPENVAR